MCAPSPPPAPAARPPGDAAYRAAWEEAADALALSDPNGIVLAANQAYARLYGYPLDQVIGQSFAVIFPPDRRAWAEREYQAAFTSPAIAPTVESTIHRADGAERRVEARYTFLTDAAGQRTAMLSIVRDITERAEALAREQAARAAAQEALQVRDAFLATVSHDLKTPLASVKALAQLARRHLARGAHATERLDHLLVTIDTSVTRMAAMLDELVDVAYLQAGRALPLNLAPVDLVALARAVVAEWRRATDRHALVLQAATAELTGDWDGDRLVRVLTNLVGNAIKYSPGGGTVTVRLAAETDAAGRGWAVASVSDEGLGIPADDLPHIFESFRRGRNVPEGIQGAGIGLASSRQIVEQHGGRLHVASVEGQGSTFTLRLPRA